jgi:TatD DNase family protein
LLIDTHLHLADARFDADRESVIERARLAGVTTLIEIAESPEVWDSAVALADRSPSIYASLGIHPHYAHEMGSGRLEAHLNRLRELAKHPKVVALGECGLDYFRMRNTKEEQEVLFRKQLELACELNKPVVIHCREAHTDVRKILGEYYCESAVIARSEATKQSQTSEIATAPPQQRGLAMTTRPTGVLHCFSGTWPDAQDYLFHGFMIGIDGPVTYPNSKVLRENVLRLPLERMILETDAPYLPPQSHRGQRNEPAYIPIFVEAIADIKHKTVDEVSRQTTLNAKALFRLR